ncbi:MAG: hypothetical protein F4Z09_08905, partial [Rhodobacteraceae bacterium]|nr:hypothetical protein [Paracoccaceae bacterium]
MTTITHTWEENPNSGAHIVKWWREVDRFSLAAVLTLFIIGVILCSSSTTPLAERNNVPSMYYFFRH